MSSDYAINAAQSITQSRGLLANKIVSLLINVAGQKYAVNHDDGQAAYARIRELNLSDVAENKNFVLPEGIPVFDIESPPEPEISEAFQKYLNKVRTKA